MKQALEFFPLIVFFVAYQLTDIITATIILTITSFISFGTILFYSKKIVYMPLISALLVGVFGFLTINEGIKVHRNDCPNSLSLQSNFAYRVLPAWWVDSSEQQFSAKLKLNGIDQIGLVNQVTRVISNNMNVDIFKINFDTDDGLFSGGISVRVKNKATLEKLVNNLLKINGIEKVTRD